jgi:hypothetical protein
MSFLDGLQTLVSAWALGLVMGLSSLLYHLITGKDF